MNSEKTSIRTKDLSYLDRNLSEIRATIAQAETESGRPVGSTLLLAAIKSADVCEINYLTEKLGVKDVGENRVQQLMERYDALHKDGVRFHFIGSLQKNKVKYIIDKVSVIHSLDTLSLAQEIDKRARAIGKTVDVYAEVNSGREENKGGLLPEEVLPFCKLLENYPALHLVGLMTMAPRCEDPKDYHGYFRATYELAEQVFRALSREDRPLLSMGMSESFREAVAEGADVVRVGRQLFRK